MNYALHHGDCLSIMAGMEPNTVDAIVTDPPYGLSFMGKHWDHGVPGVDFWREALRVLKPGGHLLAFGGTRTYHRLAVAIEDAGFEIRDQIQWLYGSGFPKSLDVSKAIDAMHGAERAVVGVGPFAARRPHVNHETQGLAYADDAYVRPAGHNITAPATPDAERWQGWGTALKPANEPICLARKPLIGTVAANVLEWGTGAINVDGCRVGTASTPRKDPMNGNLTNAHMEMRPWMQRRIEAGEPLKGDFDGAQGRWPANVIHDGSDEVTGLFPQSTSTGGHTPAKSSPTCYGKWDSGKLGANSGGLGDTGTAARFFYCAKASKTERDAGLEGMDGRQRDASRVPGNPGGDNPRNRGVQPRSNHHPTVKPVALMRYLCRLITPPGGLVLDPFMGSGSTGVAALLEGFRFAGCEMEAEYIEIARRRIDWAQRQTLHNAQPLPLWAGDAEEYAPC